MYPKPCPFESPPVGAQIYGLMNEWITVQLSPTNQQYMSAKTQFFHLCFFHLRILSIRQNFVTQKGKIAFKITCKKKKCGSRIASGGFRKGAKLTIIQWKPYTNYMVEGRT